MAEKDKRSYNILAMEGITDQEYVDNFGVPQELAYTKGINKWLIEDTYNKNVEAEHRKAIKQGRTEEEAMMFAKEVADEVIFMDEGMIVEKNTTKEFFANPKSDRTKLFLSQKALPIRSASFWSRLVSES